MFGKIEKTITILAALLLFGCRAATVHRDRSRTQQTGTIIRELPGDSIVVKHHYYDTIYRDTVIVHRTKFLNLVETYGKNGIVRVKCEQKPVKEVEKYQRETKANIKETEKDTAFKEIYFLYIGLILVVLVIINKLLK